MPLLKWKCLKCGARRNMLMGPGRDVLGEMPCPNCADTYMVRSTGGSTSVMETRDNGVMPRAVERHRDIEELRKDHADLSKPKDDGIV